MDNILCPFWTVEQPHHAPYSPCLTFTTCKRESLLENFCWVLLQYSLQVSWVSRTVPWRPARLCLSQSLSGCSCDITPPRLVWIPIGTTKGIEVRDSTWKFDFTWISVMFIIFSFEMMWFWLKFKPGWPGNIPDYVWQSFWFWKTLSEVKVPTSKWIVWLSSIDFGPQCPFLTLPQPIIGPQCPYLAVPLHIMDLHVPNWTGETACRG